jgi:hypothetical protein
MTDALATRRHWTAYECAVVSWLAAWYAHCLSYESSTECDIAAQAYLTYLEELERKYT